MDDLRQLNTALAALTSRVSAIERDRELFTVQARYIFSIILGTIWLYIVYRLFPRWFFWVNFIVPPVFSSLVGIYNFWISIKEIEKRTEPT